jgi:hypothetical protein
MKIVWYLLTAFFGLIGVLSLLRTFELLATGQGQVTTQGGIALIGVTAGCVVSAKSSGAS